jgi:drug/metabolite transporter (DMT)-like permease
MTSWIAFTFVAAFMQTLRFVLQKRLPGGGLSTAGATFARFLFAAPFACIGAFAMTRGAELPTPPLSFIGFVMLGGIAQIVATDLTVRLFQMRNFVVGVAFTKTETVIVALFSAVFLGELVSATALVAIGLGLIGILCLSRPPEPGAPLFGRSAAYGLAAGGLFAVSAVGYRGATLALQPAPYFLRAILALAAATTVQTVIMAIWLQVREPGEVRRVMTGWRRTLPVGVAGLLGSLCWFSAFAQQNAAYVRGLGQVEIVFTLVASTLIFGERMGRREALGIALVIVAVLMLVLTIG